MKTHCATVCLVALCLTASPVLSAESDQGGAAGKPQTRGGLEMTVKSVERAPEAPLNDCPPGTNTVKGLTKPGEEFAIVTVAFTLAPTYKPGAMSRPTVKDPAGTVFYTSASMVDATGTPAFTCGFPFRVPKGTALKTLEINQATFDLSGLAGAKP